MMERHTTTGVEREKDVVLVTGSNGYIGSAVCQRLAQDYTVIGFDLPGTIPSSSITFLPVDLTNDESAEAAMYEARAHVGSRIASVIHLAGIYGRKGEEDARYHDVHLKGTRRLLQYLSGVVVEQFLLASTMFVHAPTSPGKPIREDSDLAPAWDYPASKLAAEKCAQELCGRSHVPTLIVRFAPVYDEHHVPQFLAQQIERVKLAKIVAKVCPGNADHGLAILHLGDAVKLIEQAIKQRRSLPAHCVVLAGEERTLSYAELQRSMAEIELGETWVVEQIEKDVAKQGAWMEDLTPDDAPIGLRYWLIDHFDDHYELDISRARNLLRWCPQHALAESLPVILSGK